MEKKWYALRVISGKERKSKEFLDKLVQQTESVKNLVSNIVLPMEKVYKIRADKRALIPAVTHLDGTGRLQSVSKKMSPRYYSLIKAFKDITGIPAVLNTSFNENEPIVNKPEEAIACFKRTKMDILVLNNYVIESKKESECLGV